MRVLPCPVRRRAAMRGLVAAVAVTVPLALPAVASAQPDRTGVATPDAPFAWAGAVASGQNQDYDAATGEPCGKTADTYCDVTLVDVQAGDFFETSGGGVEFSTGGAAAGTDIDLYVYASDASGARGALVGSSAGATDVERVPVQSADGFFLVQVVYFDVTNSGYDGRAEFFRRDRFPADIDNPTGLPDFLASDPRLGFKSHSEPHIAQNPLDPNMLIAGAKHYNRDRDSLAEYEFKIGTYVSFDRGLHWTDLGQLGVCPPNQAPPSSWPNNRCYPDEDPNRAGTGPEDAGDDRPGGDFGEQYITSDVWVDFDDEGNAYAMVLDSPPFPSGNGWGMSFHRWETPSRSDVARGRTWSDRTPINKYDAAATDPSFPFLDDKNTFAVNNAGKNRDGKTGTMLACWGQNGPVFADRGPQQVVCERSTDGGRTWPGAPIPVSPGAQRLVIAVHAFADNRDPDTFYTVWLEYLSGLVDGSGTNTIQFSKSTDGGQTWSPATPVQRFLPLPSKFPRQGFRNLTVPIMAEGPRGELYVTYADYSPTIAPTPDEDGMHADIKLTKSLDGGATWSAPVRVNQDQTNADQFQQYIRVTPHGQLNVSFFDRRLDRPNPPQHPGNFFIDTWLARSNNGGASWKETRLSHDSWDPSINPPISPSGDFIGDYQGLAADDCTAIPFVNDTHLANDRRRDPLFDLGTRRSQFQEVFSWLVPNISLFGGRSRDCIDSLLPQGQLHAVAQGAGAARAARAARAGARALSGVSPARTRALSAKAQIITGARRPG
jgi:hypothetical protein